MLRKELKYWFAFSLFNLILVAAYGVLMRYKIGFEFPYFSQKHLLHAHSHFAFAGWISQTLMVLMVMNIKKFLDDHDIAFYKKIFIGNLISAFGMLIAFTIEGYGVFSITFSTASIIISYLFAWKFITHLKSKAATLPGKNWYMAALFFSILSTFGTFVLVYMMITKSIEQHYYLGADYYYLHFQYNGWFFFACMGLLWNKFKEFVPSAGDDKTIFWMFAGACVPAYFLSALWMPIPVWIYVLVVAAAISQVYAWVLVIKLVRKHYHVLKSKISGISRYFFLYVTITLSIKLLLQLFSTIPTLSHLAFGFRPIVIAYLHLVLLAIITVFLLTWLFTFNFMRKNKWSLVAMIVFLAGVFLNEFALMIQGIAAFAYFPIPYINECLFAVALVMLVGAALLFYSQKHALPENENSQ